MIIHISSNENYHSFDESLLFVSLAVIHIIISDRIYSNQIGFTLICVKYSIIFCVQLWIFEDRAYLSTLSPLIAECWVSLCVIWGFMTSNVEYYVEYSVCPSIWPFICQSMLFFRNWIMNQSSMNISEAGFESYSQLKCTFLFSQRFLFLKINTLSVEHFQ